MAAGGVTIKSTVLSVFSVVRMSHPAAGGIYQPNIRDLCVLRVLCVKPYSVLITFVDSAFLKLRVFKR